MRKPYVEPEDYIPEELRKKYKLGEYNEDVEQEEPEQETSEGGYDYEE